LGAFSAEGSGFAAKPLASSSKYCVTQAALDSRHGGGPALSPFLCGPGHAQQQIRHYRIVHADISYEILRFAQDDNHASFFPFCRAYDVSKSFPVRFTAAKVKN